MPRYHYKAVTSEGNVVEGTVERDDRMAVVEWLKQAGHVPIRAEEQASAPRALSLVMPRKRVRPLPPKALAVLTAELAAMLDAGLALERAMQILINTTGESAQREVLEGLLNDLRGGSSLSNALASRQGMFPPVYLSLVRAAESGGELQQGLARLADYLERQHQLREQIRSALFYPLVLLGITVVSLLLILIYVVPRFADMFTGMESLLPDSTIFVLAVSDGLRQWWWVGLLALLVVIVAAGRWFEQPRIRARRDALLLRLPLLGELVRQIEVARFSRSLGVLLGNGVPLLEALALARDTLANASLSKTVAEAVAGLKAGGRLADSLSRESLFPQRALEMLRVGEESGRMEEMLLRVANLYERESAVATQRLLTLAEPVMIVAMGLMVAGVVISILMAIVSVNDLPL